MVNFEEEKHCNVLGVSLDASPEQIKLAYRRLALQCHPDKNGDNVHASEKFVRVKAAYDYLQQTRGEVGDSNGGGFGEGNGRDPGQRTDRRNGRQNYRACADGYPRWSTSSTPRTDNPNASKFKLKLTFADFKNGKKIRVPLTKGRLTKMLEVRIPPGARPGDIFLGFILRPKNGDNATLENAEPTSEQDQDVYFILADAGGQLFDRLDNEFSANLRHIYELSDEDWLRLSTPPDDECEDGDRHFEMKIPTINGDTIIHRIERGSKLREFRFRGFGLPLGRWSQHRGDLVVFLKVLPPHVKEMKPSSPSPGSSI